MTGNCRHWDMDRPFQIRVYGEPQPFPKKEVAVVKLASGNVKLVPVDRDYRTRTDPHTHKLVKYEKGYKRRWMKRVRNEVATAMLEAGLEPFPKNHPVAMGCLFYLTKAKSNKLALPSQTPDLDNLSYAIWNALERQPVDEHANDRFALTGVLYYNDSQVVWQLPPAGKLWATEHELPGVLITVQDAFHLQRWSRTFDEIKRHTRVR